MPSPRLVFPSMVLLAIALCALMPGPASAAGRVIGGSRPDQTNWTLFQSLVSINVGGKSTNHFCGGVRIAPALVLTARHCVESGGWTTTASRLMVMGGSSQLDFPGDRVRVRAIYRSPEAAANWRTSGADLAILELERDLRHVGEPAFLARPEHAPWWGAGAGRADGVFVAGWGIANDADIRREVDFGGVELYKLMAAVPVLASSECARRSPYATAAAVQICAGQVDDPATAAEEARSSCYGDSGGPLVATDPAGLEPPRVVGIVSRGTHMECGAGPGIYVPVADHAPWIDRIVERSASHRLRDAAPVFRALASNGRGSFVATTNEAVGMGDGFVLELQPRGWTAWLEYARFTGPTRRALAFPTRTGDMKVRVRRVVDGIEQSTVSAFTVRTKRDVVPPRAIARFTAIRRGHRHLLDWAPTTDRGDRVVGYIIEQRPAGKGWRFESYDECAGCWTSAAARPSTRSTHVLLPGRRFFRIAALDRAGNRGPWTTSR